MPPLPGRRGAAPGGRSRPRAQSARRRAADPAALVVHRTRPDRDQQAGRPRGPGRDRHQPPRRRHARTRSPRRAERPRLVHRLDRDTSGVLVLARDAAAAARARCTPSAQQRDAQALLGGHWSEPERDEGLVDLALAKRAAGRGERVPGPDEEDGARGPAPLPRARPCRQGRGLDGAAAAHRPHPPAPRALRGDRRADPGRRQIWRQGGPPERGAEGPDAAARELEIPAPMAGRCASRPPAAPVQGRARAGSA